MAANFPFVAPVFRLMIFLAMRGKGDPLGVIRKTALSLVQARREENDSFKVNKL